MLDVDAAKGVRRHLGAEVDDMGQRGTGRLRGGRLHMGGEPFSVEIDGNGTSRTIAGGGHGLADGRHDAVVVAHQEEVDGLGVLGSADDAQAVARQGAGVELQADVHILARSRAEALPRRLRGVYMQRQRHLIIGTIGQWREHEAGTPLLL